MLHGGGEIGALLCAADEVAVISFTGSAATGAAVARAAGPKRLVLELGGNAATIVCEDADIPAAARICARTGYTNSGQSCVSVQRVYVQRDRFAEFLDAFTAETGKLRTGDPLDDATDVGSMVDDAAAERVVRWTAEAAAVGAEVLLGGTRDGATVHPTVVADPPATASVVVREVFGALVAVLPYTTFGEVIETCNASRYGLQAGLFTQDIGRVFTAWRELQVGGLVVNGSSNFRLDHVPFGGVKDSGFGRESPRWMIEDYTVVKTLLLRGLSVFGGSGGSSPGQQSGRSPCDRVRRRGDGRAAGVLRRRVRLRYLRAHQHRAARRHQPQPDPVRHRAARAGGGARRRRVRAGYRQARRAAASTSGRA